MLFGAWPSGGVPWDGTIYYLLRGLAHICRLWPLLAFYDLELDRIALLQALVAFAGGRAVMHEHIGPVVASDKAISFRIIEPLYRSFQRSSPNGKCALAYTTLFGPLCVRLV